MSEEAPSPVALRAPPVGLAAAAAVVVCGVCGAHLDASTLAPRSPADAAKQARTHGACRAVGGSGAGEGAVVVLEPVDCGAPPGLGADGLTPREHDIVRLLMQGYRVSSIARLLSIAPSTVHNHLRTVRMKYGVGSQAELVDLLHERWAIDADIRQKPPRSI